ncbi:MAG: Tex-like N-terminal domain-containing protein, partial [Oscillospiraceae bacterium]
MDKIVQILAAEFKKPLQNTEAVVGLIDEGNTIPFIARYRKEMTGSMDDQLLREMFDRLAYLRSLDQRRAEVKESIASQEKLTDELAKAIDDASTLAEVEDLYRPYKPKRRTRASIAREKGLEPLAEFLFAQDKNSIAPEIEAEKYTDAEKKVATADDALAGARDIIAENTSDDAEIRKKLRALLQSRGTLVSAGIKDEDSVYRIYYEFSEPVGKLQSHRILAINRGEREGFLKVSIELARPDAMKIIGEATLKPYTCATSEQVKTAIEDSYDRLIFPSIERDIRNLLTERADEQAIKTFALNLKPLLMQPPIKNMVTLGLDPAYRTGCKIA